MYSTEYSIHVHLWVATYHTDINKLLMYDSSSGSGVWTFVSHSSASSRNAYPGDGELSRSSNTLASISRVVDI